MEAQGVSRCCESVGDSRGEEGERAGGGVCAGRVVHSDGTGRAQAVAGNGTEGRARMPPTQATLHVLHALAACVRVPRETTSAHVMSVLHAGDWESPGGCKL